MAQTIAMQRGSTSFTCDSTWNTLFTQSSGTATRVIPNQLNGNFNTALRSQIGYFQLALVSSSGSGQILSSVYSWYMNTFTGFQIACLGNQAGQYVSGQNPGVYSSYFLYTSSAATPYNASISASSLNFAYNAGTGPGPINQFYMGNGDSLRMRIYGIYNSGKGTANATCTTYWNMTTITES